MHNLALFFRRDLCKTSTKLGATQFDTPLLVNNMAIFSTLDTRSGLWAGVVSGGPANGQLTG
jgi:hypothetical protein